MENFFSPAELKLLSDIIHHTWEEIAYDLLADVGKLPRDEVIECVLDADRLSMSDLGSRHKDLVKRFYKLPFEQQDKIAGDALGPAKYFTL